MRKILAILSALAILAFAQAQAGFPGSGQAYPTTTGGFTNLFTIAANPTASGTSGVRTYVTKVQPDQFGNPKSGNNIRLTFCANVNGAAIGANVGVCTSGGANSWSCAATPTQITWNGGSNSFSVPAGGQLTSDKVPYSLSGTQPLNIAVDDGGGSFTSTQIPFIAIVTGGQTNTTPATVSPTSCNGAACWTAYNSKAGVVQAMTAARDGGYSLNANNTYFVCKVEVSP